MVCEKKGSGFFCGEGAYEEGQDRRLAAGPFALLPPARSPIQSESAARWNINCFAHMR